MDVTEIEGASPEKGEGGRKNKNPTGRSSPSDDEPTQADADDIFFDVAEVVRAHPVGSLLAACGAGYVIGGGVFTSLTKRLLATSLRLGMQLAVLPALEREIADLTEGWGHSPARAGETAEHGAPQGESGT